MEGVMITRRKVGLSVAGMAVALSVALVPALPAAAEGWVNFSYVSCGSTYVGTRSNSDGITEHYQRNTPGSALMMKSWDNGWGLPTVRTYGWGFRSITFGQVWTNRVMWTGSAYCGG